MQVHDRHVVHELSVIVRAVGTDPTGCGAAVMHQIAVEAEAKKKAVEEPN